MTLRPTSIASMLIALCSVTAAAQRCAPPDTTAEWFTRQRAWLSDAKHDWSDNTFRQALVAAAGVDTTRPLSVQLGVQRLGAEVITLPPDTSIWARLRTLAATRSATWPTRSVVGAAGVRAVWLLVQYDTALQRTALHRMMESGPDEALAADVAVLEDRVRLESGRKQLYGSQVWPKSGGSEPIEDSAHVDMRREAAGLPPLRQALCMIH